MTTVIERLGDPPAQLVARHRWFARSLVLVAAGKWLTYAGGASAAWLVGGVLVVLSFGRRTLPAALVFAAGVCLAVLGLRYPSISNHHYLLVFALVLMGLTAPANDCDRALGLASVRWLALIVFMWTGLQKALYGAYFHGDFLVYQAAHLPRFRWFFEPLMSGVDLDALAAAPIGSYRGGGALAVVAGNVVWLGELVLPLLLLVPRARTAAAATLIAMTIAFQLAAREFWFALIMVNLLLLFLPGTPHRRAFPILAGAVALLLLRGWWVSG